jgi:16S rRNA processing protein RimM
VPTEPPDVREIGRIGRAHGVRGELYVDLITDRESRLAVGARVRGGQTWLTVSAARPQTRRWLVRFEGIDDRNAADQLVGRLLGSQVIETDGTPRGTCTGVVANPAHDLLELDDTWLVPVVFVVAHHDGVVTIDPPDGLFE